MSSGLAIIGIAISVWAGLNIANAIEKKEVEDIKSSVKEINELFNKNIDDIENVKNNIEDAKIDVNSINRDIGAMSKERQVVNWNTFLQELLETGHDAVSRYFYTEFSGVSIEWGELIKMVLLEQNYSQIYNNYGENSRLKDVLLTKIKNGIEQAEELEESLDTINNPAYEDMIKAYLQYRKTEFHFMSGYMVNKEESYKEFELAAEGFDESQRLLKINLPRVGTNIEKYVQLKNVELAIFFANSIGESYSKITQNPPMTGKTKEELKDYENECSKNAIFYLELAVKMSEKLPQREVYYRNLGCAYERKDNNNIFGENSENIIGSYRKALKAVISYEENKGRVQKVYHTLLSYYEKYLKNKLSYDIERKGEIDVKTGEQKIIKTNVFVDLQSFETFIENLKNGTLNEHITSYLHDFNHVSELAVIDNPRFSINRSMYGFSLSWVIVLLLIHNEDVESKFGTNIEEYLKEIHKCVLTLELMQMSDDYYKDLKNRYEILSAYCKEHEII